MTSCLPAERDFQRQDGRVGFTRSDTGRVHCRLGEQYEKEFCFYLAKHAEINCNDRICLIGQEPEWATIAQERLFLNKSVDFVDCSACQDPIDGQWASKVFDRIILLNCLDQLNEHPKDNGDLSQLVPLIYSLRKALAKSGRLVLVHRASNISTLPLPAAVITRWHTVSTNSARLIEQLSGAKEDHTELSWEIPTIKFQLEKFAWFNLLMHRMFYPLTLASQKEIADGLRELNETYLKYHHDLLEIYDRLLFLTMDTKHQPVLPSVQPLKRPPILNPRTGRMESRQRLWNQNDSHEMWDRKLLITDEMAQLFNLQQKRDERKRNLFRSSLDFMS